LVVNMVSIVKNNKLIRGYILFVVGLFIAAIGVALSTKSGLGTSPVSSVPYSVSLINDFFTLGGWINLWSVIQISIQIILLRRKCNIFEIVIQTLLAFSFGYMTNFGCSLLKGINAEDYGVRMGLLIASCFVLAFGIWLQLKGGVAMLPGEAMNRAISTVTNQKYENIKIIIDVLYIVIAVIICMVFIGELKGVREGSIIAAFSIGFIIKLYNFVFRKITKSI